MKVCHLSCCHSPNDIRIFHKECRSLVAAGYDVSILVPNERSYLADGVRILSCPLPRRWWGRLTPYLVFVTQFQLLIRALKESADVYHLHDQFILLTGVILKLFGKKVIYDVHEDYPRQFLSARGRPQFIRKAACMIFEVWEQLVARAFNGIIAVTDPIHTRFARFHRNVALVRNFPIISEFIVPNEGGNTSNSVVYVGYITEARGILEMIDAVAQTPYRLRLAGKFATPALFEKCIGRAGWRQVDNLGYLDRNGIGRELASAAAGLVVLHPIQNYLEDSLPIKLFEYMAAGLPVIVSDFPAWRRIVDNAGCGICVNPLDPSAIARAIRDLVENKQRAREMGRKGREAVLTHYQWEGEEEVLMGLYENIADGAGPTNRKKHLSRQEIWCKT